MSARLFLAFVVIFLSTISLTVAAVGFLYGVVGWGVFLLVVGGVGITLAIMALPGILQEEE